MHGSAASAISVVLFGLTAFAVLGAAGGWARLSRHTEGPTTRPAMPIHALRSAAGRTAVALGLLGLALAWSALVAIP